MSNWLINYNGLIVDFKDVGSGVLNYADGSRDYFLKIDENAWSIVHFSKEDLSNSEIVGAINQAFLRAGTKEVNRFFMDILTSTFPSHSSIVNDNVMREKFLKVTQYLSQKIKLEADKYKYYSDYRSVFVNGIKYTEGQIVYLSGNRYIVKVDSNGEGYLDLLEYPEGNGFVVTQEQRFLREQTYYLDYSRYNVSDQFLSTIIEYSNGRTDISQNGTILLGGQSVQRIIQAPFYSDVTFYECVDFTPGSRDKVTPKGTPRTLEEGELSSKGTTSSQPSLDYGDWEAYVGGSNYEDTIGGPARWKKLKEMGNFRAHIGNDAIWFKATGSGFEEVYVSNFHKKDSPNRKKVDKIYYGGKYKSYLSDAFIEELKKEFGYKVLTFEEFVNKYKKPLKLREPKGWSNAPHHSNIPSSGTKTLLFGKFTINSGSFKVDVRYNTFLKYVKNGDTISRGQAKLELIEYSNGSYSVVDTLFDVDYNVGNYWDRSTDKVVSRNYLGSGIYGFKLTLIDTYQDTQTIYVRALPTITEYSSSATKEYDKDASFKLYVTDIRNNSRIPVEGKSEIILQGAQDSFSRCFEIVIPKGSFWLINNTVIKGNISSGGILGTGAAARLRNGVIKYTLIERIPPMIIPSDDGAWAIADLPDIGWVNPSEEEQEGEAGEKQNPFIWFDAINIESYEGSPIPDDVYKDILETVTCNPLGLRASLNLLSGGNESEFRRANRDVEGLYNNNNIELRIKNPFNTPIKVELSLELEENPYCGGGGFVVFSNLGWEFWGRGSLIGDGIEKLPSVVRIAITELVSSHEIIGGCPGCYAEILVKDTNGNVLETIRVDEGGWVDFKTGNLFNYNLKEFDIEIKTYQKGYVDPRGYDVRCLFVLDSFNIYNQYELSSASFNSELEFYINDELKLSVNEVGEGEHYFPVKKGLNRYKFVFKTNNWDYNWDYVEIPWIRLTNWICDDITVVPYCEPSGGDKCIEALIACVLGLLPRKLGCAIIRYIDYISGEVMKQEKITGYSEGEYTFTAPEIPDFEVVGDRTKTVFIEEKDECAIVEFYYRRLYRDCVYVIHRDIDTGNVILREQYSNLLPGEYVFSARAFNGYEIVGLTEKSIVINYLYSPPEECKIVEFEYRYVADKDPYLDCVWVIHREGNNVLSTDYYYNLEPGVYKFTAKDFEGYEVVGEREKEIEIYELAEPVTECKVVIFEYRKIKRGCVIVKFIDRINDVILDTDYYYDLLPGEYDFHAKEFEKFKLVDNKVKTILVSEKDTECKEVIFLYEPLVEGCVIGKKIWLFT